MDSAGTCKARIAVPILADDFLTRRAIRNRCLIPPQVSNPHTSMAKDDTALRARPTFGFKSFLIGHF